MPGGAPRAPCLADLSRARERSHPDRFLVAHYRALHADVMRLDDSPRSGTGSTEGSREGRRAKLTRAEVRGLRELDVEDYRDAHADLSRHDGIALVQHYLDHGLVEGRRPHLTPEQRSALKPPDMTGAEDEMRALHEIEPWIPLPGAARFTAVGPPL